MKSASFGEGDHVVYFPTGSEATNPTSGVIKRIIHERKPVGQASEATPRYVIVNDKTQKEKAFRHENIIEMVNEGGTGEEQEESDAGLEIEIEDLYPLGGGEEEAIEEYDEKEYVYA